MYEECQIALKTQGEIVKSTANGYSCLEKLATEKCKHKANQPEKKILKIKDFMKDL